MYTLFSPEILPICLTTFGKRIPVFAALTASPFLSVHYNRMGTDFLSDSVPIIHDASTHFGIFYTNL